ncbi:hypothetical protein IWQ54_006467 [Labrenzia sp. EL_195]|nr:hypothetical protein [Labrenzia sp. EL_195]
MTGMKTPDGERPNGRRPYGRKPNGSEGPQQFSKEFEQYAPERKKIDWETLIILLSAFFTGLLTMIAAPAVLDASGILGWMKYGLIGLAAMFVSGVINYFAIQKGADLAARGFRIAPFVSLMPVIFIGFSAATFSYSGLVIDKVDRATRQEHGAELLIFLEEVNAYAVQGQQLIPGVDATAADLNSNLEFEETEGGLSGGAPGRGAVYRAVLPLAERASEIAGQLETSDQTRQETMANANRMLDQYNSLLSSSDLSADERDQALMRKSGEIKAEIQALKQTLPVAFLQSYARELDRGVVIGGKREATERVNAMLARNGASIEAALEELKADKSVVPVFPPKAGVSEAMDRIGQFWPIAMLTYSIELTIPVVMWMWAYLAIVLGIHIHTKKSPSAPQSPGAASRGGRHDA